MEEKSNELPAARLRRRLPPLDLSTIGRGAGYPKVAPDALELSDSESSVKEETKEKDDALQETVSENEKDEKGRLSIAEARAPTIAREEEERADSIAKLKKSTQATTTTATKAPSKKAPSMPTRRTTEALPEVLSDVTRVGEPREIAAETAPPRELYECALRKRRRLEIQPKPDAGL